MPFTLDELIALRPFAFHVCGALNFASIRATMSLRSPSALLGGTAHEHRLRGRRRDSVRVTVGGHEVEIRDHRPLAPGSLLLPKGYTIEDFVDELNSRVFLWAGTKTKPVRSGRNRIARYAAEGKVYILRVPLLSLVHTNPAAELQVTFCNAGAARHNQGRAAIRSPNTFVSPSLASKRPAKVVEFTIRGQVALPSETVFAESLAGPWTPLR